MGSKSNLPYLLSGLLLFAARPGHSFGRKEHEAISQAALEVAILCAKDEKCWSSVFPGERQCPLPKADLEQREIASLRQGGASSLSYGNFVSAVDFVLDPATLLEQEGDVVGLPEGPSDLNEYWLYRLRELRFLQAWAAQNNTDHFQQKALTSWWFWHRRALDAATTNKMEESASVEGRHRHLYAALVMNAIANHYLEDFLAPGHVITPRESLHDYAALSMHDLYNREGVDFKLPGSEKKESLLAPFAFEDKEKGKEVADLLGETESGLKGLLDTIRLNSTLKLRGDRYLYPSPHKLERVEGLEKDSRLQRIYMAAVVARSVLDVLHSYACDGVFNTFDAFTWSPTKEELGGQVSLATGGLGRSGELGLYPVSHEKIRFGLLTPVEISLQVAPWETEEHVRGVASFVYVPTPWAPPPGRKVNGVYSTAVVTWVAALGVDYRIDEDLPGFGAFTRFSLIWPRLDANVGLGLGFERYSWHGRETFRFHPELRAGIGLSFVMLFWGVGYDHDLNPKGDLKGVATLRAGVAFGLPWSKIHHR